ncbi:MAG: hypothetical protein JWM44_3110 [Bacilli bacterium]|nr:hypothetical protein [Bacilli bacterium]
MRIPVIIPDEHHEELRRIAYEEKSSMSEEVRKAIAEYLERKRKNVT